MMRAPNTREPFDWIFKRPFDGSFAFNEAQWRWIESSLAFPETKINLDAEMVGGLFRVRGQQPRSLRQALSEAAHYAARAHAGENRVAWKVVVKHAPDKSEGQAREMIRTWLKNGVLVVESYENPKTRKRVSGLLVDNTKRPGSIERFE